MPSPVLWPIAGAAALNLGRRAAGAVSEGLSFAAELARLQQSDVSDSSDESSGSATSALAAFQQQISLLAERISQRLSAAGIVLSEPVKIVSDGLAGLAVGGGHPQRAAIEEALSTDLLLARDFDRLADDYRELTDAELQVAVE